MMKINNNNNDNDNNNNYTNNIKTDALNDAPDYELMKSLNTSPFCE